MTRLPTLSAKKVIRALERAGFQRRHSKGGHHTYRHTQVSHLRVTVPVHSGDLAPKTLRSIIKQAGLTLEEFLDLL